MLDAGELSWISRDVQYMNFLKMEGYHCQDTYRVHRYGNQVYNFTECECKIGNERG